ncbi:14427_t:CDS:1, partial [Acaulospora morrowiae]
MYGLGKKDRINFKIRELKELRERIKERMDIMTNIEKELAELMEKRDNSIFFKNYYQKKILEKEEE